MILQFFLSIFLIALTQLTANEKMYIPQKNHLQLKYYHLVKNIDSLGPLLSLTARSTWKIAEEADLCKKPIPFGFHTNWIGDRDQTSGQIFLKDGSCWEIDAKDFYFFDEWEINDSIIIGYNDSGFTKHARILINANTRNFIRVSYLK